MRALTQIAEPQQLASLLEADEGFARDIPAADRPLARRALMLPVLTLERGPWRPPPPPDGNGPARRWMLVVDGMVGTHVAVGRRPVVHLLGPGDLVVPPPADPDALAPPCSTAHFVEARTTVMVLDDRFAGAARAWPSLSTELHDRLALQYHRLLAQGAVLALPHVQDRITAVLRSLAATCGRVRPDGVLVPLRLTHTRLGEMTAARRPTVSLALRDLAAAGVVTRVPEGWLIAPGEDDQPLASRSTVASLRAATA